MTAHTKGTPRLGCPLTEREIQVLEAVASGLRNDGVACRLHLSTDTVKTHLRRAFAKLGAADRSHAVAEAFRHGYLWVDITREIHAGHPGTFRQVA